MLPAAATLTLARPALASSALATQAGCATCHMATNKLVGPSCKDIAATYKGRADEEQTHL